RRRVDRDVLSGCARPADREKRGRADEEQGNEQRESPTLVHDYLRWLKLLERTALEWPRGRSRARRATEGRVADGHAREREHAEGRHSSQPKAATKLRGTLHAEAARGNGAGVG